MYKAKYEPVSSSVEVKPMDVKLIFLQISRVLRFDGDEFMRNSFNKLQSIKDVLEVQNTYLRNLILPVSLKIQMNNS